MTPGDPKDRATIPAPKILVEGEPEEWLPSGWTVKLKIRRDGKRDKFYFPPSGEVPLNSKVGVLRHLGLDPKSGCVSPSPNISCLKSCVSIDSPNLSHENTTKVNRTEKTSSPADDTFHTVFSVPSDEEEKNSGGGEASFKKCVFERVLAEGLPPGLIKGIKVQKLRGKIWRHETAHKDKAMIPVPKNVVEAEPEDWLPSGWTVKLRIRGNGKRDKFYISPSEEVSFNSKVGVLRHLGLDPRAGCRSPEPKAGTACLQPCVSINSPDPKQESTTTLNRTETTFSPRENTFLAMQCAPSENERKSSEGGVASLQKGVFERVSVEGLPPGWIKEIKVQKIRGKIRRDPYFTDPVHGYVFRSMKDTLRYIETGDPGRLAIKPKSLDVAKTVEPDCDKTVFQPADGRNSRSKRCRRTTDNEDSTYNHDENAKVKASSIQPKAINYDQVSPKTSKERQKQRANTKSGKKGPLGVCNPKIKKHMDLCRRSSGRLAALKDTSDVQSRNEAVKSTKEALSHLVRPSLPESSNKRTARQSILDNMTTVTPGKLTSDSLKSPLVLSYEESWLDPCIDFAVKTLTGASIPTGDQPSVEDYYDQSEWSSKGHENRILTSSSLDRVAGAENSCSKFVENREGPGPTPLNMKLQRPGESASSGSLVRGTDRSLFR